VVDVQIGAPWARALCDATQVHQVLMNLGTNALQALRGADGRVDIGLTVAVHRAGGVWPACASICRASCYGSQTPAAALTRR
jgi:signal transduction histidine kinase